MLRRDMSRKISVEDYPEHLNPFDENYNGVVDSANCIEKYHTWSSVRSKEVNTLSRSAPTTPEKPWTILNISPKNKIVRRLSILRTAVERFASKKSRLSHTTSLKEGNIPAVRSHSFHDEFAFRIISPKIKEKLRQQAFSTASKDLEANCADSPNPPQPNGRLPLSLKVNELNPHSEDWSSPCSRRQDSSPTSPELQDFSPTSPEPQDFSPTSPQHQILSPTSPLEEKEFRPLGARPKVRKKKPPPPPPAITSSASPTKLISQISQEEPEDSHSVNSSITQDLEKDLSSGEDVSLTEFHDQNVKPT